MFEKMTGAPAQAEMYRAFSVLQPALECLYNINSIERQIVTCREGREVVEHDRRECEEEIDKCQNEIDEYKEKIRKLNDRISQLNDRVSAYNTQNLEFVGAVDHLSSELARVQRELQYLLTPEPAIDQVDQSGERALTRQLAELINQTDVVFLLIKNRNIHNPAYTEILRGALSVRLTMREKLPKLPARAFDKMDQTARMANLVEHDDMIFSVLENMQEETPESAMVIRDIVAQRVAMRDQLPKSLQVQ
ncbi:MAG: hypothetical protein EBQ92_04015 [Proteobacteria bacterium]|nr:hypothetical protein [Pseudomonadota bacterium]